MHQRSRLLALAVAVIACGCSAQGVIDALSTKEPTEDPGTSIDGATGCTSTTSARCLLWSGDSKTLFVNDGHLLKAVDVATGISRTVGVVQAPYSLVASADGASIYFAALTTPSGVYPQAFAIYRIPTAGTAPASFVTAAASSNFVLAPNGNVLAYHAAGGLLTSDTLAALDIASGVRLGSTIAAYATLLSSSPDASSVAILLSDTGPQTCTFTYGCSSNVWQIWHPVTSIRDIPAGLPASTTDLQWTQGEFRALFGGHDQSGQASVIAEISLATATVTNFAVPAFSSATFAWAPNAERVFAAGANALCYDSEGNGAVANDSGQDNCASHHYIIESLSPGASRTIGSINTGALFFSEFRASPDGHWLAYSAGGLAFLLPGS